MGSDFGSDFMDFEKESDEEVEQREQDDDIGSMNGFDTKSRFTEYSMTSSVIRRNQQLSMLDDKFEEVLKK